MDNKKMSFVIIGVGLLLIVGAALLMYFLFRLQKDVLPPVTVPTDTIQTATPSPTIEETPSFDIGGETATPTGSPNPDEFN